MADINKRQTGPDFGIPTRDCERTWRHWTLEDQDAHRCWMSLDHSGDHECACGRTLNEQTEEQGWCNRPEEAEEESR